MSLCLSNTVWWLIAPGRPGPTSALCNLASQSVPFPHLKTGNDDIKALFVGERDGIHNKLNTEPVLEQMLNEGDL